EVASLLELDDDVRVRRQALTLRPAQELPGHAEVHDQHLALVQEQQQILALPVDLRDLPAGEQVGELLAPGVAADDAHRVSLRAHVHVPDAPADDLLLEVAPDHLYLGQLHPTLLHLARHLTRPPRSPGARAPRGRPVAPPLSSTRPSLAPARAQRGRRSR